MQGGGLYITGDATLNSCHISNNEADEVFARFLQQCNFPWPPWNVTNLLAFGMKGGGLRIDGHANLNSCEIYDNEAATSVCARLFSLLDVSSSAPMEHYTSACFLHTFTCRAAGSASVRAALQHLAAARSMITRPATYVLAFLTHVTYGTSWTCIILHIESDCSLKTDFVAWLQKPPT